MFATTVINKNTLEPTAEGIITHDQEINIETSMPISNSKSRTIPTYSPAHDAATNISTTNILGSSLSTSNNLSATVTNNLSTAATSNLSTSTNSNTTPKPSSNDIRKFQTQNHTKLEISDGCTPTNPQLLSPTHWIMLTEFRYQFHPKPKFQHYLSLLVISEDVTSNNLEPNQPATLTNNIPPATITDNKFLAAIFPFKLEEITTVPLFSGAIIEEKPIMVMYTDTKVDGQYIKLILDSGLAGSIITKQLMDQLGHKVNKAASTRIITANEATKTPIGKIDNFPFEINGIIVPIKVLVMEATQYQALVGNDWLTKTNAIFNWTTQKLQLSQNGQYTQVPATCGHFKPSHTPAPLIDLEEEKPKPT
ncbi:hypothetical protein G9A89_022278 [Geosiphon pyriformis]|nr:hypothetical protein G9A89_022278 [Geosiphon pyriformis]